MSLLLGIDLGSSSVKVCVFDSGSEKCLGSAHAPEQEMEIQAPRAGFAEQDPEIWWQNFCLAFEKLCKSTEFDRQAISAIGIAYQMHGLVTLDAQGACVRPAIIWCDSRAVESGQKILKKLGEDYCFEHLLNAPGNFTLSKLIWLREHEPESYKKIKTIMLPGDYLAFKLSGERNTTSCGLSEAMLWDHKEDCLAEELLQKLDIPLAFIPEQVPVLGEQSELSAEMAERFGMRAGIPISYRAGDQPNNAASLGVFEPGQIATTAGTSGVIYAPSQNSPSDKQGRVNTFLHVNHSAERHRQALLMCVNGCAILQSWLRKNFAAHLTYAEIDQLAAKAAPGSQGLRIYPYGNGAERTLKNLCPGASFENLDFNKQGSAEVFRAAQEGIAFALCYGLELLHELGISGTMLLAGRANLYLSPIFQEAMVNTANLPLRLLQSDGAVGAALMAGVGAGIYKSCAEASSGLRCWKELAPQPDLQDQYAGLFDNWKSGYSRVFGIVNRENRND